MSHVAEVGIESYYVHVSSKQRIKIKRVLIFASHQMQIISRTINPFTGLFKHVHNWRNLKIKSSYQRISKLEYPDILICVYFDACRNILTLFVNVKVF